MTIPPLFGKYAMSFSIGALPSDQLPEAFQVAALPVHVLFTSSAEAVRNDIAAAMAAILRTLYFLKNRLPITLRMTILVDS